MRPTFAEINLSNLKQNFLNIRKKTKNKSIMAVVKADAYGHGVKTTVETLLSLKNKKPEYFAVAIPDEGIELRKYKVKQPILIFEPFNQNEAPIAFDYNLTATVFTEKHLSILQNSRKKLSSSKKLNIHIKVDTGMNRLGIRFDEAYEFIKKVSKNKNFILDGIYTHFATSDERDKQFANLQLKRFDTLITELNKNRINYGLAHTANSGAILDMPDSYYDMVRPGISLYGYYPSLETTESIPLAPVLSLVSEVASIKTIKKGETVSYGRKFTTDKKTKIISVPIGYADGFNRGLTNKATAIIKGNSYKQVGRVTMDRVMFDVKNDDIRTGDKVILLGKQKKLKIDAWDWGKILNTIPYEIICNISKRVPRVFKY